MIRLDEIKAIVEPTIYHHYTVRLEGWRKGYKLFDSRQLGEQLGMEARREAGSEERALKVAEKMVRKAWKRHANLQRKSHVITTTPPREDAP